MANILTNSLSDFQKNSTRKRKDNILVLISVENMNETETVNVTTAERNFIFGQT
jgi:hypothetical protein